MTKYKVNRGDRSERGDKVISPEAKQKLTRNKGKHIEGQHTETSGSAWERDWVVGLQILTLTCHDFSVVLACLIALRMLTGVCCSFVSQQ